MLFPRATYSSLAFFILAGLSLTCTNGFSLDAPKTTIEALTQLEWKLTTAKNALETGFPSIAEKFLRELTEQDIFEDSDKDIIDDLLIKALLAQNKYTEADLFLENASISGNSKNLFSAIIAFQANDYQSVSILLSQISPQIDDPEYEAWYFTLSGIQANRTGNLDLANDFFDKAKNLFPSEKQRILLEHIIFEEDLILSNDKDEDIESLQQNIAKFEGQNSVYRFIRRYAILLAKMDQNDEALQLLQNEIDQLPSDSQGREILLQTYALITGFDSPRGSYALREIIQTGKSEALMKAALQEITIQADDNDKKEEIISFITLTLNKRPTHPIVNELLLTRAQFALSLNKLPIALSDADSLSKSSDLYYKTQGLLISLSETLRREQPQYRLATDYIIELQQLENTPVDDNSLQQLLADCFYLNDEFDKAASAYQSLLEDAQISPSNYKLYYRKFKAEVSSNQIENARVTLTIMSELSKQQPLLFSSANWTFYQSIPLSQSVTELVDRLNNSYFPEKEAHRFRWLAIKQALQIQEYDTAERLLADEKYFFKIPDDWTEKDLLEYETHLALLNLKLLLQTKKEDLAKDAFASIIEDDYLQIVTEKSFIEMARYLVKINKLAEARLLLNEFIEKYPESKFAPIALYENALSASTRNTTETNTNAIQQFKYLIDNYPEDPRAFFAHLKIADIFRQAGSFADARSFYEETLAKFNSHPLVHLVQMGLGDTLNALNRTETIEQAILIYKDLIEDESLSVDTHVEAYAKIADIYKKLGDLKKAETAYWDSLSNYLLKQKDSKGLQVEGRWWMSRTILHLGDIFLEQAKPKQAIETFQLLTHFQLPGSELGDAKIRVIQSNQ